MTGNEIRQSGLLELYVIGEISDSDRQLVEQAIATDPSLLEDISSIEASFEAYAQSSGIKPSTGFKEQMLQNVKGSSSKKTTNSNNGAPNSAIGGMWKGLSALFLALLLGCLYYAWTQSQQNNTSKKQLAISNQLCDSLLQAKEEELSILYELRSPDNQVFAFTPTANFQQTDILLFTNNSTASNFLKIDQLPAITADQSYQLWSLKEGMDPIPLTVFQDSNGIIPIDFEPGTATYAITIEKQGGAKTPDLSNLIGTITFG